MGVEKTLISQGDGSTTPKKGDVVTMEYTGWLYDPSKPENKGNKSVPTAYVVDRSHLIDYNV
jgi:FK506-binding protein 1